MQKIRVTKNRNTNKQENFLRMNIFYFILININKNDYSLVIKKSELKNKIGQTEWRSKFWNYLHQKNKIM